MRCSGWIVAWTLGLGCEGSKDTSDSFAEGDTDIDVDTDADSDADTDVDIDCSAALTPEDLSSSSCATDLPLACNETRLATIEGGSSELDTSDYGEWFCWPSFDGPYDGPERVYEFIHPSGTVTIQLDSPCENLDLFVFAWTDDTCPTGENSVFCDYDGTEGTMSIDVWEPDPGRRYLVVVEGPQSPVANFGLTTICP